MKSNLNHPKLRGLLFVMLCSVTWAGFAPAVCAATNPQPEMILLSSDAVTITHQTQFVTLTNGAMFDRAKQYLNWQAAKVQGNRFPPLSPEITVGGLANLYRSVDTLSPGIMVPLEFFNLRARFPTNCILTNAQTSPRALRSALQQVLRYNGIVGVREGPLLKLVKSEWVHTNSTGSPLSVPIVQPGGPADRSQPVRPDTNQ